MSEQDEPIDIEGLDPKRGSQEKMRGSLSPGGKDKMGRIRRSLRRGAYFLSVGLVDDKTVDSLLEKIKK